MHSSLRHFEVAFSKRASPSLLQVSAGSPEAVTRSVHSSLTGTDEDGSMGGYASDESKSKENSFAVAFKQAKPSPNIFSFLSFVCRR